MATEIKAYYGDTVRFRIALVDKDAQPIDLTDITSIVSTVAYTATFNESFNVEWPTDIEIVGPETDGVIDVHWPHEKTIENTVQGTFWWDIQLNFSNGDVFSVPTDENGDPELGIMTVIGDATRDI